jgi:type I restriction enzyme M protein
MRSIAISYPALMPESRDASLGFESKLWDAADLLRSSMDPAEYKHVVLGLLFLKYISDAFEERRAQLRDAVADPASEYYVEDEEEREQELEILLEDRDEYAGANVFWVPVEARWEHVRAAAKRPEIGRVVDDAMEAIAKANPRVRGVLPMIYGRPALDKQSLGKLIDLVSGIGLGTSAHRAKDTLGQVYQYFLAKFASAEGKGGGEFYTPKSVVELLVEMLEPFEGRVFDPCCGSGGMFVQSMRFIEAHGGQRDEVSIFGQEYNPTTWRLARMNLAIRGIEADLGPKHADSFREDLHPDLRADFVIANPPFNISQWHGEALRDDVRWKGYGAPPVGNANYAWILHFLHHLSEPGTAGFVMANGSMSSMTGGEGEIREKLVRADRVDCMVALPGQLFYSTQIPVCLWFLTKDKGPRRRGHGAPDLRDRRGEVLFIDARGLGRMDSRVHKVLDRADIQRIAETYHAWRNKGGEYADVPGFCKSAGLGEIERHRFVLTPGRYVGIRDEADDGEPFGEKMTRFVAELKEQMEEGARLDELVTARLGRLGYAG